MQISVWEKESFFAPKDIIIIGSGFTGLWAAWFLKKRKPSVSITIIERGAIPTGASTRNAGFACFGSITELIEDTRQMGEDRMLDLVQLRFEGLSRIQKVFGKKKVDFELCGGYDLLPPVNVEKLKDEIAWLNKKLEPIIGKKKTYRLSDEKLEEFGFHGIQHLVENKLEGSLHSGKLSEGLVSLVQSLGVTILNSTEVFNFERSGDSFLLNTSLGLTLKAGKILICTNAFARELLPQADIVPARGQVLLTSPIEDLSFEGTFHYDQGFYYFRNLGTRILLGGARNKAFEEETTTEFATTSFIQDELERFLREQILPGRQYTITDRWSGIMAMGSEKMPIMKEVEPGLFCAVRMSGMGVALAPKVGEMMAERML